MSKDLRTIVEETFSYQQAKALWTANYSAAIPFTPQDFDIGAILPAILYMSRWGHRRGRGAFNDTFGQEVEGKREPARIVDVVGGLLTRPSSVEGFDDATGHALLGDLLLAWCLENRKHALGHDEQVQRVFPTHYLASWIDLPKGVINLRGIPELIVAILADQQEGAWVVPGGRGHFRVEAGFDDNVLLKLFARHMTIRGEHLADKGADFLLEAEADSLGIDELLAIRIAQACGHAPDKARGKNETERIPNQWPLPRATARRLREDLAMFVEVYGGAIPRQAFLQMFEAGVALGLTNVLLTTTAMLLRWEAEGMPTSRTEPSWVATLR